MDLANRSRKKNRTKDHRFHTTSTVHSRQAQPRVCGGSKKGGFHMVQYFRLQRIAKKG